MLGEERRRDVRVHGVGENAARLQPAGRGRDGPLHTVWLGLFGRMALVARGIDEARYQLAANEQTKFYVPNDKGHDDHLMSLALCWHAAETALPPA